MGIQTIGTPALWIGFTVFVLAMLAIDLGIFHRKARDVNFREAIGWTAVWVGLAAIFNFGIWYYFGHQKALEFLTGYLIEEALSVDNVFVFLIIFSYFKVPKQYQHKVLFWGVVGAQVMRAIFIFAGAAMIQRFHWVIYIFGALLVFTGLKLMFQKEGDIHPERNIFYRLARKVFPTVPEYRGQNFFTRENGKLFATPLFLVLITVEATDLLFAVDSIPAIFAVTTDPFIVYTSNVFAILGLRSLFFVISGVMDKFHYLKIGLSLVLIFVGVKMLIVNFYKIPILVSLGAVAALLGGSIVASMIRASKLKPHDLHSLPDEFTASDDDSD